MRGFKDTAIKITTKDHLGAVIGLSNYKFKYIKNRTDELINKIKALLMISIAEPQVPCSCFITAFKHKPSYIKKDHTWHFRSAS